MLDQLKVVAPRPSTSLTLARPLHACIPPSGTHTHTHIVQRTGVMFPKQFLALNRTAPGRSRAPGEARLRADPSDLLGHPDVSLRLSPVRPVYSSCGLPSSIEPSVLTHTTGRSPSPAPLSSLVARLDREGVALLLFSHFFTGLCILILVYLLGKLWPMVDDRQSVSAPPPLPCCFLPAVR